MALLLDIDELTLNFDTKIPPDFFDAEEPFTLIVPDRRVVLNAHISNQINAPGLVYILLPEEKA